MADPVKRKLTPTRMDFTSDD